MFADVMRSLFKMLQVVWIKTRKKNYGKVKEKLKYGLFCVGLWLVSDFEIKIKRPLN